MIQQRRISSVYQCILLRILFHRIVVLHLVRLYLQRISHADSQFLQRRQNFHFSPIIRISHIKKKSYQIRCMIVQDF